MDLGTSDDSDNLSLLEELGLSGRSAQNASSRRSSVSLAADRHLGAWGRDFLTPAESSASSRAGSVALPFDYPRGRSRDPGTLPRARLPRPRQISGFSDVSADLQLVRSSF